jgi:hypothetical protein
MNKALKDAGFGTVNPLLFPRIIMALSGHKGHGKSHFAFTAPGPIGYFNLDMGEEGVIQKFCDKKKIYPLLIPLPATSNDEGDGTDQAAKEAMVRAIKKEASTVWNKFIKAYYTALAEGEIRTIIIDTSSELWELLRLARFGRASNVEHLYTPVNAEFKGLFQAAVKAVGTNVIFLHRYKEEWIKKNFTGNYIPAWFKGTPFGMQIVAHMRRIDPEEGESGNAQFNVWIQDCRLNADLIGKTLPGPLCNFPTLAQMALPQTKAEDWV